MKAGDESFEKLRAALDEVAAQDAEELLSEARAEARARVRSMLTDALAHTMLEHAHEQLGAPQHTSEPKRQATRTSEPKRRTTGEQASYVYGVIGADRSAAIQGIEGITVVREGDLAAAAGRVPLEDFDEHTLRENLGDMAWVERTARAHERVLEEIRSRTTVIPMRMCTVYRTESGLREMLSRESDALRETLSRLRDKTEWGVKVLLDPSQRQDDRSSAAAYMHRRREQLDQDQNLTARVQEATTQIHESLCAVASEGVLVPLQRPEASGRRNEMVLNGAYLVEDAARDRFGEQVGTLQDQFASLGLVLELTGPWPAYNFVGGTIGATL
jgi:hypothetical protein